MLSGIMLLLGIGMVGVVLYALYMEDGPGAHEE